MCSIEGGNTVKKTMKSAVAVTFAMVLSLALGAGTLAQAAGKKPEGKNKLTIMEELDRTNGTEALLAAIQVADESLVCSIGIAELLDDKKANLVLLAPPNEAWEVFLHLIPGTLKTFDVDMIARMLPGLLGKNELAIPDLCDVLERHISMGKKGKKGGEPKTLNELLEQGSIVMLNESEYPVAIGGGRGGGICVNYDSCITERDVQTQNGVIHYLHKILEEPPPEDPPVPEEIDAWCSQGMCGEDQDLHDECVADMQVCLAASESDDECYGASLFKCSEREGIFDEDGLGDSDGLFDGDGLFD